MREEQIFHQVLEQAADQRAAFLDAACGGDDDLRQRVEVLLRAQANPGSFLQTPAPGVGTSRTIDQAAERPGTQIGPYKLLQQIGEGGMGVVYMAEQSEPVQRRVALKIIKPGMDTRQVIARFEAERQALAMMDHPNIAKVFEAGTTESGRPYFVMELVKGIPITRYCDEKHLSLKERLELMIPVCQAIQHAHQKGIIHRDIKPTNVLVAQYDGRPVPKVIDFGVAKATAQKLTEQTMFTELGQVVGTVEYMSPEQAELNQLDIDTRSDIYSLGVLLYELLTGTTPFDKQKLRSAAFHEMLRIIREDEPPKPSTSLSTSGMLASISANRQSDPARLSKAVRGELDWIVMKALEKDRNRRYETANGLAADVQRYLNDEAVQACPPSAWYRFRKFSRRNSVVLTTAALVSAALVLGTGVSSWQAVRAARAQKQAESEALNAGLQRDRAEGNMHLALQVLHDTYRDMASNRFVGDDNSDPWRREFLERMLAFQQRFLEHNRDNPTLMLQIAKAAGEIGDIYPELGDHPKAKQAFDQSIGLLNQLLSDFPDNPTYRQELGRDYMSLGRLLAQMGQRQEGEGAYCKSIAIKEALAAEYQAKPIYRLELARSHSNLGVHLMEDSRLDEAEQHFRAAVDLTDALASQAGSDPGYRQVQAAGWHNLGSLFAKKRQSRDAVNAFRRAAEIRRSLAAEFPLQPAYQFELASSLNDAAIAQEIIGEEQHAEESWREHQNIMKQLVARSPTKPQYREQLAQGYYNQASLLEALGKRESAKEAYRLSLDLQEKLVADFSQNVEYQSQLGATLNNLGRLLDGRGETEEARRLLERAVECQRAAVKADPRNPRYREYLGNHYQGLVEVLLRLKDRAGALRLSEEAVKLDPDSPAVQNGLAWTLANFPDPQFRDPARAVELAKKSVELAPLEGNYWNTLGVAQYRAGDWKASLAALDKSMELRKGGDSSDWFFLAMGHWQIDEKAEAHKWYDQAVKWMDKNNPKNEELHRFRAEAAELLGSKDKSSLEKEPSSKPDAS